MGSSLYVRAAAPRTHVGRELPIADDRYGVGYMFAVS